MYYKPNIVEADIDNFERHTNGYKINVVKEFPIGNNECTVIMIWKQYDPPDILLAEATIPNAEYISNLMALGHFPYTNRECVLIKAPSIGYGDKCEEGATVPIEFPNEKCKLAVAAAQGNMDTTRQDTYDLIVLPEGWLLANRVLADDDIVVKVHHSLPDSFDDTEVEDKMLIWHNFWLIAVRGTARKMMKKKKRTIKEEKALRKKP